MSRGYVPTDAGPATDFDPAFDALFYVGAHAGMHMRVVGRRAASPYFRNCLMFCLWYGWVLAGVAYRPGEFAPARPRLAVRTAWSGNVPVDILVPLAGENTREPDDRLVPLPVDASGALEGEFLLSRGATADIRALLNQ